MGSPSPLTDQQRTMVEQNLGLVVHALQLYYPHLVGDDDAYHDGVIGLARATRDYQPDRARFSTYAIHWIRSEIGNGLGRLHGINARAANRRGASYRPPASLDAPLDSSDDAGTLLHLLTDPGADPADTASHRALLAELTAILNDAVNDDLDRDIAHRIVAQILDHQPETRAVIAARHGCVDSVVQYRGRRLIDLLRSHLRLVRTS